MDPAGHTNSPGNEAKSGKRRESRKEIIAAIRLNCGVHHPEAAGRRIT